MNFFQNILGSCWKPTLSSTLDNSPSFDNLQTHSCRTQLPEHKKVASRLTKEDIVSVSSTSELTSQLDTSQQLTLVSSSTRDLNSHVPQSPQSQHQRNGSVSSSARRTAFGIAMSASHLGVVGAYDADAQVKHLQPLDPGHAGLMYKGVWQSIIPIAVKFVAANERTQCSNAAFRRQQLAAMASNPPGAWVESLTPCACPCTHPNVIQVGHPQVYYCMAHAY